MSLYELSESIDSLKLYMSGIDVEPSSTGVTVCLLGGELTTLSVNYLKQVKEMLVQRFSEFAEVEIGIQTNLIMSTSKLDEVYNLFNGNIGTSIDNFSSARKFKGSSDEYKLIFNRNHSHIEKNQQVNLGGCYVVGTDNLDHVGSEVFLSREKGYPLKLIVARQSSSGSKVFDYNHLGNLINLYLELLDGWFMKSSVSLDPFMYMLNRKIVLLGGELDPFESCNMTNQCHKQGVCIEPNGDFYFCQELADLRKMRLGNLLSGDFDVTPIEISKFRESSITVGCSECKHFTSCKGGCMAYALDIGELPSSKDPYCALHHAIYDKLDELLVKYPKSEIIKWKSSLK